MLDNVTMSWLFAGLSLFAMAVLALWGRKSPSQGRIDELSSAPPPPKAKEWETNSDPINSRLRKYVEHEEQKHALRQRLIQAGFYNPSSEYWLTVVKAVSLLVPVAIGAAVSLFSSVPPTITMLVGVVVGMFGLLAPSFVLDARKSGRQKKLRRSIPDALDVLSICLEGGMSLPAALSRVSEELSQAHPDLALELAIVDRESRMGMSVGQAMRQFADRFDLEEIRSMSSVILQAETYGASLVDAMNVFAMSMREKRSQHAETKAQQAVIQIIFPTLFCIFPALFLVVIGPAAIQIYETLVLRDPL